MAVEQYDWRVYAEHVEKERDRLRAALAEAEKARDGSSVADMYMAETERCRRWELWAREVERQRDEARRERDEVRNGVFECPHCGVVEGRRKRDEERKRRQETVAMCEQLQHELDEARAKRNMLEELVEHREALIRQLNAQLDATHGERCTSCGATVSTEERDALRAALRDVVAVAEWVVVCEHEDVAESMSNLRNAIVDARRLLEGK